RQSTARKREVQVEGFAGFKRTGERQRILRQFHLRQDVGAVERRRERVVHRARRRQRKGQRRTQIAIGRIFQFPAEVAGGLVAIVKRGAFLSWILPQGDFVSRGDK